MTGKQLYDELMLAWSNVPHDEDPWVPRRHKPPILLTGTCVAYPFLSNSERIAFQKAAEALTPDE